MTLREYLRLLRRQWWVVVLLGALATGAAALYSLTASPVYTAKTQLFISVSSSDNNPNDLSSGSTFTQQRVKSYADIVTSKLVMQQVINQVHLPYTTDQLAGRVTADSPQDTVLLNVSVSDSDPQRAADIADAVIRIFPQFVDQIETPHNRTTSPVKVSVTQPPGVPVSPESPRVPLNLVLGLLVGLGLGLVSAVLRDQLNTSISGVGDIEQITGAVPLGVVPFDRSTVQQALVDADDQGGRAEAFRALRTNLQFTDVDHPPRLIVISSPLPSEGKSTTSSNIAHTLALSGAKVVLVEGDLRMPTLGKYLGLSNAVGLTNVLAGQYDVRDVLVSYQGDSLVILPSGPKPPNPSELLGSVQMRNLLALLREHFDYVVIDAPPLLRVTDAAILAAMADGAVLVTRYGSTTRENLEAATKSLEAVNAKLLGTVLNFAPRRSRGTSYDGYGYGYGPKKAVPRQRIRGSRRPAAPNLGQESVLATAARPPAEARPPRPSVNLRPFEDRRSGATSIRPEG